VSVEHQDRDDPFNAAKAVTLDAGTEATVRFEPQERQSDYFLATVAISKRADSSYLVETDGTAEYGPAPIPPTDPDDDSDTFRPPTTFSDHVEITVQNLDSSATRTYYLQVVGWERRRFTDEGGF
jgi:hypothetical protein